MFAFVVCFGKLSLSDIPIRNNQAPSTRQETGWLAGGPLLRDATIRRTTDTHTTNTFVFISYTTNVVLFKFRCNIFIGVRMILKKMSCSVTSGTPCIRFVLWCTDLWTSCCPITAHFTKIRKWKLLLVNGCE
jgi:hypothetical protein